VGSIALARLPAEFLFAAHLAHEALLHLDAATAAHHLEHFAHLGVLAEEVVDVLDRGSAAAGDALAAVAVDDLVVETLFLRHRVDDGFDAVELAFVDVFDGLLHAGEGADGRQHFQDGLHAAHLLDLTELVAEVFEGEAVAGEGFFGELLGFAAVEGGFGAFEEGGDVAVAHDAAYDAVGAGHGVGDEEDLAGVEKLFELRHLVHEGGVDLVAAGGVDDEHVAAEVGGFAFGFFGEAEDGVGAGFFFGDFAFVEMGGDGAGDDGELLAGGGTVDVHRYQHRPVAGFFEPLGEFAAGGRFAGALEAGHQDDGWRLGGFLEAGGVFAEDVDEFVVDDFDDLLGGGEGGGDFFAESAGADVLDELVDDGEVDVGLEEGEADLAEGVGDVLVGDGALAAEGLEGTLEFVA